MRESFVFMGGPLAKLGCVRTLSVAKRATRPDVRWDVLRANPAQAPVNIARPATETVSKGVANV